MVRKIKPAKKRTFTIVNADSVQEWEVEGSRATMIRALRPILSSQPPATITTPTPPPGYSDVRVACNGDALIFMLAEPIGDFDAVILLEVERSTPDEIREMANTAAETIRRAKNKEPVRFVVKGQA